MYNPGDGTDTPPPTTPPGPTSPPPSGAPNPQAPQVPTLTQINDAYRKYLGRPLAEGEYNKYWNWSGTPADWQVNWQDTIQYSPEAQAYAKSQQGDPKILMSSPTGPFQGWNGWGTNGPPAWTDPTMAQVEQQPGYQFSLQQGQQALEQDKAQQGLLYGGGTLKDILTFGQNFAAQQYSNYRNQALNSYQTNVGNWSNAWDRWNADRQHAVQVGQNLP